MSGTAPKQFYFDSGAVSILASSEEEALQKARFVRLSAERKVFEPAAFLVSDLDAIEVCEASWSCFVYVMKCGAGPVKIGGSNVPSIRMREVQTGNPYPVTIEALFKTNRASAVESRTHKFLAKKRMCGEWFDVSVDEAVEAVMHVAARMPCLVLPHTESVVPLLLPLGQRRDLGHEPW
jgi:hypothetical protein